MKTPFAVLVVILFTSNTYSQCSDAGVCFLSLNNPDLKENGSYINLQYSNSSSGSPYNVSYNQFNWLTGYSKIKYNLFKLNGKLDVKKKIFH